MYLMYVMYHNRKVLHPEQSLQLKGCGCQEARNGGECIEEGKNCLTDNVCYLGTLDYEISHPVTRTRIKVKKKYFGLSQDSFRSRHSGHKTSFKLPKYKASTKLSTAIWKLKVLFSWPGILHHNVSSDLVLTCT